MKDEKEKKPARMKWRSKYTRFYAVIGAASLILALIIVGTATALADRNSTTVDSGTQVGGENEGGQTDVETPVVTEEKMTLPVLYVDVSNDHGFFHNQTLGYYGHHDGVDFKAEVGENVFAVLDGTVESIYKGDAVTGTEITLDHGDGLKTVYRFVTEAEGLKAGDSVLKGQQIATVAEADGGEYKDGAHLHFEVLEQGVSVDPAGYLPMEEK